MPPIDTALATLPHNLPPSTTLFVGREAEIADIVERLRDASCRLLTIVGPGGMGKTRLALEAARHLARGAAAARGMVLPHRRFALSR